MDKTGKRGVGQGFDFLEQYVREASLVIDAADTIRLATPAIRQLLGYEGHELQGRDLACLWPEDQPIPVPGEQTAAFVRHRDGSLIPIVAFVIPFITGNDERMLTMMDASELQRLNNALTHTQRLAGIGTLTASVAHELTSPLSIITATCSNLLYEIEEKGLSPERLVRYVALIEQSAFRGARIVEVLRNYAHLGDPQVAVTDVKTIVRDSLTLVEQQFLRQSRVRIAVSMPPGLNSIVCDHNRITQVLINLLTNARDAMQPDGGTIDVRFWAVPAGADAVGAANGDDGAGARNGNGLNGKPVEQFGFSVRDRGPGIPDAFLEQVFRPFFTTKPGGQGTGLGLFIARGIIEQHHGRIWASNNEDGGATFTVVLPQRQEAQQAGSRPASIAH